MAKLSEEEAAQLKALQDKAEAPDEDEGKGRILNFTIDLSDDNAVARALKLGFLRKEDLEDGGEGGEGGGEGGEGGEGEGEGDGKPRRERKPDKAPRRRGYFGEGGE